MFCVSLSGLRLILVGLLFVPAKTGEVAEPETVARHSSVAAQDVPSARTLASPPMLLPQAVASFGAAESNNWLYVYGGHLGKKHHHSKENLTGAFYRMNLLNPGHWEELPPGTLLQSVALVSVNGVLYRIGGMTAYNSPGEEENLQSLDEVMRFDPAEGTWSAMPPLPDGRSSHDATVLGDRIYVAGGWKLRGRTTEAVWHDSAWMLDPGKVEPHWEKLPDPPFRRRAVAMAAADRKVFVLGGMTPLGEMSADVFIFDPVKESWSEGPALPFDGFGMSAIGFRDRILVSGIGGIVYQLRPAGNRWEEVRKLAIPRIFHRLVAAGHGALWALGGATKEGHIRQMERIELREYLSRNCKGDSAGHTREND